MPARRVPALLLASLAVAALPAHALAAGSTSSLLGLPLPIPTLPMPVVGTLPDSPEELAPLTGLLDTLAGGSSTPTTTQLAPVTTILTQLGPSLPAADQLALGQLLTDLQAGGASPEELAQLGDWLQQLAATPGVSTELADLLNPIASSLGGTGGLVGLPESPAELAPLTTLLGTLTGAGAPDLTSLSPAQLAPLTTLLGQVQAQLPADQQAALATLLAALAGGDPNALGPIAALLDSLATAPGVPAPLSALLGQLSAAVGGGSVPGLTGLPASPAELQGLLDLLAGLQAGGSPSLTPLVTLLETVSAQLPAEQRAQLDALIAALGTGAPGADVLAPVGALLQQLAGTPGVPPALGSVLVPLGTALGATPVVGGGGLVGGIPVLGGVFGGIPGGIPVLGTTPKQPATSTAPVKTTTPTGPQPGTGGGGATVGPRATIQSVKVDRKRTKLTVVLRCPAGASACTSYLFAAKGTTLVTKAKTVAVPAGGTSKQTLLLTSKVRKQLRTRGLRVTVAALGSGGASSLATSVKRTPKAKTKAAATKR